MDERNSRVAALEAERDALRARVAELQEYKARSQEIEAELRHSEALHAEACRIAKLARWEWDYLEEQQRWTDEQYELVGRDKEAGPIPLEEWRAAIHPADRDHLEACLKRCRETREPLDVIYRIRHPKEGWACHRVRGRYIYDNAGNIVQILGVTQDITDLRRIQDELTERESDFVFAQQVAHIGSWKVAVETGAMRWSDETYRIFGFAPKSFAPTWDMFRAAVHPSDLRRIDALLEAAREEPREYTIEFRIQRAGGQECWLSATGIPREDESGNLAIVAGIVRDITEERQAAEALEMTRFTVDRLRDSVFWVSDDGRFIDVNEGACHNLGYSREELLGMTIWELDSEASIAEFDAQWEGMRERKHLIFQTTYRRKDGTMVPVEVTANFLVRNKRETICAFVRDITQEKRAEIALHRSEVRYKSLYESMNEAFCLNEIVYDSAGTAMDYRILDVNSALESYAGMQRRDLINKCISDILKDGTQPLLDIFAQVAETGVPRTLEYHFPKIDRHFHVSAFCPRKGQVAVLGLDITDRIRAEKARAALQERMLQAQKLESLGVLAGGIAHDFNNILSVIMGNAELALGDLPHDTSICRQIAEVKKAARRAADLAAQMLAYAGKGRFQVASVSLNDIIADMRYLLDSSVVRTAELTVDFAEDLPAILADTTQLRQVVLNIVINASEALGGEPGTVAVRTRRLLLDAAQVARTPGLYEAEPGEFAALEVRDNGCGMDKATVERMFDPFYSTKFTGRGLGMASVQGIVKGHKGLIQIETASGEGTLIRVCFPASGEPPVPFEKPEPAPSSDWRGKGAVLIADDEPLVLDVAKQILSRIGFDVTTAKDGQEALDIFENKPGAFRLVILDYAMPRLNGEKTLKNIRLLDKNVPILLASGFTDTDTVERVANSGCADFIQKPFTRSALLAKLQEMLGEATLGNTP